MGEPEARGVDLGGAGLADIAVRIREGLEKASAAREDALRRCRATIQHSSRAIRALHRGEFANAERWLAEAREQMMAIRSGLAAYPGLYHAGCVHDAQKEYAEASLAGALLRGLPFADPETLQVEPAAYLNGLAEAGSEGRRYVLDRLRSGDLQEADRVLQEMDEIYYELISCDFPDAVTGGLRRTTDAYRAVLERTRGDLTLAFQQASLQEALRQAGQLGTRPSAGSSLLQTEAFEGTDRAADERPD